MVYPNGDEVYYTDFVYLVTQYTGELYHDSESDALKWFDIHDLPKDIIHTQTDYIDMFLKRFG